MTNAYNLDALRNDLDSKHESITLDLGDGVEITLVNAMRLSATARKSVLSDVKLLKEQSELPDQDPVIVDDAVNRVLEAVVADDKGPLLTQIIDGDTQLAFHLFDLWMKVTQAGEA